LRSVGGIFQGRAGLVICAWEPLRELIKEPALNELIREHWEEAGPHKAAMPLDIAWPELIRYADADIFRVVTARRDGEFLGYMTWWITPHLLQRSTPRAVQGPWNLLGLLGPSVRLLEGLGIVRIEAHLKIGAMKANTTIAAYERLGFEPMDMLLTRVLPAAREERVPVGSDAKAIA
jgi:hypothetical protein